MKADIAALGRTADHMGRPDHRPEGGEGQVRSSTSRSPRIRAATPIPRAARKKRRSVLGWKFTLMDGKGTATGGADALAQAIALKPDAIILGCVSIENNKTLIKQAPTRASS